jgi:hypothetical protein
VNNFHQAPLGHWREEAQLSFSNRQETNGSPSFALSVETQRKIPHPLPKFFS